MGDLEKRSGDEVEGEDVRRALTDVVVVVVVQVIGIEEVELLLLLLLLLIFLHEGETAGRKHPEG